MLISENVPNVHETHLYKSRTDSSQSKKQIQHHQCVANFLEIVKGFGMLPNKILQKSAELNFCKMHEWVPPCPAC